MQAAANFRTQRFVVIASEPSTDAHHSFHVFSGGAFLAKGVIVSPLQQSVAGGCKKETHQANNPFYMLMLVPACIRREVLIHHRLHEGTDNIFINLPFLRFHTEREVWKVGLLKCGTASTRTLSSSAESDFVYSLYISERKLSLAPRNLDKFRTFLSFTALPLIRLISADGGTLWGSILVRKKQFTSKERPEAFQASLEMTAFFKILIFINQ